MVVGEMGNKQMDMYMYINKKAYVCVFIYSWFSLFTVVMFFKVTANIDLASTKPLPLGETQG